VRLDGSPESIPIDTISNVLQWSCAPPGLHWTELEVAAGALRIPVRAIVVRLDPSRFRFELRAPKWRHNNTWTIDSIGSTVALAVNAGQFKEAGAWGWVRIDGRDHGLPGSGELAYGIAFDTAGALHWIAPRDLAGARQNRALVHAFQSYPMLLFDGTVPGLALDGRFVDQDHRDARLILAQKRDGSLLFILTRFDALGRTGERVPIGLTLPESIALSRALGARNAIMLDGGISAQMLVRTDAGVIRWRGLRSVPLGLVAVPG